MFCSRSLLHACFGYSRFVTFFFFFFLDLFWSPSKSPCCTIEIWVCGNRQKRIIFSMYVTDGQKSVLYKVLYSLNRWPNFLMITNDYCQKFFFVLWNVFLNKMVKDFLRRISPEHLAESFNSFYWIYFWDRMVWALIPYYYVGL